MPNEKLPLQTPDTVASNVERIRTLFPNCVTETHDAQGRLTYAVDFDQLRQELSGEIVEGPKERYQLTWPGKRQAILTANAPIRKTLRPARDESVDFDTTQNLFIEGDNLNALKLLQETYLGKVKMIYIDPPYNTGKDFVYKDNFAQNTQEYLEQSGQKDEEGNRMEVNSESNGRYHSDWLTMMYSRLKIARNLLREDGVIFISIDDNEAHNARTLFDEILGADNFIGTIIHQRAKGGGNAKNLVRGHDYCIAYAKQISSAPPLTRPKVVQKQIETIDGVEYIIDDDIIRKKFGKYDKEDGDRRCFYEQLTEYKNSKQIAEIQKSIDVGEYFLKPFSNGMHAIATRVRLSEARSKMYSIVKVLSEKGDEDLKTLGLEGTFTFPKPIEFIRQMIDAVSRSNDIILDFFAGSGTTGHAVMKLNAEDGGTRKYICVQLPEVTDEKSEARKAGYPTIAEITKERLRRAGRKIKEEHPDWQGDTGFRVLKIDSTCMKDVYYAPAETRQSELELFVDNIKDDRSAEDLLFQVMIDLGVPLDLPIAVETVEGFEVYSVAGGALVACFAERLTESAVKAIAQRKPDRMVFRDSAFGRDSEKINAEQIRKHYAPESVLRVV